MSPADDTPSTLGELVRRHAAGGPDARNAILSYCHDRFKTLTRRMLAGYPGLGNQFETTAVYHDVWVKLAGTLDRRTFGDPGHFLRYAACVIRSHLLDLTRKKWPDQGPDPGPDGSDPLGRQPAPGDAPDALAAWGEFHAAIDALPPDQRELFELVFYLGLTVAEAAKVLGVPKSTLQVRWQAARLELRRRFGDELPD